MLGSESSAARIDDKEGTLAKGQMRSNKEKKQPKADWNKKQTGVMVAGGQSKQPTMGIGKK